MGDIPVSPIGGPGVASSSVLINQPAGQQLAVGLMATAVRDPAATLDISKQAREAADIAARARETETLVSPVSETDSSKFPVDGRRRNPYMGRRRRRGRHKEESPLPQPTLEGPGIHLDVTI